MFLQSSRRCSQPQHGSAHLPYHTSSVQQKFRCPPVRVVRTVVLHRGLQRFETLDCSLPQSFVSLIASVETPCWKHKNALDCCSGRKTTLVTVRFLVTSSCVLGPPHRWCVHRVHPASRHNMRTSNQLISAHLFVKLHTVQEVELFLQSLLLGGFRHVLVSLKRNSLPSYQHAGSQHEPVGELRL